MKTNNLKHRVIIGLLCGSRLRMHEVRKAKSGRIARIEGQNHRGRINRTKALVRTKEAAISAAFESQPAVITEFFPNGMTEYSRASVGNAGLLMERLVGVISARAASLPTGFVTLFNDIKTQFAAARTEQQDEKGHVTNVRAISSAERTNLCKQLYKNLCNITALCVANPAEGIALFDESLLWGRHGKKAVEPVVGE